ncbi:hypothetical protein F4860DRAFT_509208 [Xylaria cubensis]|nr:hypothetical protein F4860DRAFT_509208 [Xylaria cubensis]
MSAEMELSARQLLRFSQTECYQISHIQDEDIRFAYLLAPAPIPQDLIPYLTEYFDYEDNTSAAVTGLPSLASSFESDAHKNKKLKKTKNESRKSVAVMNIAATGRQPRLRTGAEAEDCTQRGYQGQ